MNDETRTPAKPKGWFSRRHETPLEHMDAKKARQAREDAKVNAAVDRKAARDALTPRQQINRLNKRLGKGVGAVKERARLTAQIKTEKKT